MPERTFKYFTKADLLAVVKSLGEACASPAGTTNALRNSHTGFLAETGPLTPDQLRQRYQLARWEIYLRGRGVDGQDADADLAALEPQNPLRENVRQVEIVRTNPYANSLYPPLIP